MIARTLLIQFGITSPHPKNRLMVLDAIPRCKKAMPHARKVFWSLWSALKKREWDLSNVSKVGQSKWPSGLDNSPTLNAVRTRVDPHLDVSGACRKVDMSSFALIWINLVYDEIHGPRLGKLFGPSVCSTATTRIRTTPVINLSSPVKKGKS